MRRLAPTRHPYFPWNGAPIILEPLENPEGLPNSMPKVRSGFLAEWKRSDFKSLQDLFTTIRYVATYTVIVYNHCQGIATSSIGASTDKRNSDQHQLLFLPAYQYEKSSETPYKIHESTRLAAQMYSLLALYPYHPSTAPFEELVARLRKEVSRLDQRNNIS
jgi:hypothetical protein